MQSPTSKEQLRSSSSHSRKLRLISVSLAGLMGCAILVSSLLVGDAGGKRRNPASRGQAAAVDATTKRLSILSQDIDRQPSRPSGDSGWRPAESLRTGRIEHTATLLPDDRVLIAGGENFAQLVRSVEIYDPAAGRWRSSGDLAEARMAHTATLLSNGKVVVAGGRNDDGVLSGAEVYDPGIGSSEAAGPLRIARESHTATPLRDGGVLVAGGKGSDGSAINSAELFDASTGQWTPAGYLHSPRADHTATLLPDGRVLVAGGFDGLQNGLYSAEIFDPATGAWTVTGNLHAARANHTATLLYDGRVLVAGGNQNMSSDSSNSAEIYDPATGSWIHTGSLFAARRSHTATLLSNGRVLVAGGASSGRRAISGAEIYDPARGIWTEASRLNGERYGHTASMIGEDRVLVVGGAGLNSRTAELFAADFSITQPKDLCVTAVSPKEKEFDASGFAVGVIPPNSVFSVTVTAGFSCRWTVSNEAADKSWITLQNSQGGTGHGLATYSVSPNTGPAPRVARLNIGGKFHAITQRGAVCTPPGAPGVTPASRCGSGSLTLSSSLGTGGTENRWYSSPSGGSPLFTGLIFTTPALTDTTVFYVSSADATGCESDKVAVTATINPLPDATVTAAAAVCPNSTGNSASVPDAGSGASYNWTITNGSITAGQDTRTIAWTSGASGQAVLNATVTNSNNCSATGNRSVAINSPPDATITAPAAVCANSTANSASVPDAGPGASYNWTISNGSITSGQGTRTIAWTAAAGGPAILNVTVTNNSNCSASSNRSVTITSPPSATITASAQVCANSTGNSASAPDAGANASYNWTITNGSITSGQGTRSIAWTAGSSGTITLGFSVTAGGCPAVTSTKTIAIVPSPDATISAQAAVCANSAANEASVPDAGANASYNWTISNGSITSGQGTRSIRWTAGSSGSVVLGVTVTNSSGCSATGNRTAAINSPPDATIAAQAAVCANSTANSASVPDGGPNASYNWTISNGSITSGQGTRTIAWTAAAGGPAILNVTVMAATGGCSGVSVAGTKSVAIDSMPAITAHPASRTASERERADFSVSATGAGLMYQWFRDDIAISGATGSNFSIASVSPGDAGNYRVTVRNSCGNVTSNTAVLTVAINFGQFTPNRQRSLDPPSPMRRTLVSGPITLNGVAISRTGNNADDSRRADDGNDRRPFSLLLVQNNRAIFISANQNITVGTDERLELVFDPLIPARAGCTSDPDLRRRRSPLMPDRIESQLTYSINGNPVRILLEAGLTTRARLIDPCNPVQPPLVTLQCSAAEFKVTSTIFDPNLDVYLIRYQFLDRAGNQVFRDVDVDVPQDSLQQGGVARGQSFTIEQRFSGTSSFPNVAKVRVIIFDRESNDEAESAEITCPASSAIAEPKSTEAEGTLEMPVVKIPEYHAPSRTGDARRQEPVDRNKKMRMQP